MRPDDEIDALIDDVARSMTEPVGLRAWRGVKPRPTGTEVGRAFTGRRFWRGVRPRSAASLAWAAAIAVLASAIVFMTREPRPAETPVASATPPAVATPAPLPRVAEPPKPVTTRAPRPALAEAPVDALEILGEGPVRVEPVVLDAVAPMPLELEEMETPMPLRAEWIQIELLNIQ